MGYNKTDSSEDSFNAFMRWAKGVRQRLRLRERSGLLTEEGIKRRDKEKNKPDTHNN